MQIATLLVKHLGVEDDEYWCDRALVAIGKIKNIQCRFVCQMTIRLFGNSCSSCEMIRTLIGMLRSGNIELIDEIKRNSE